MPLAKHIYNHLPAGLRSTAATLRGFYLQSWRYSEDTEILVNEALDREYWSAAKWDEWQNERISHLIERAARTVPFYREYWERCRRSGSKRSWRYLENWPILEKESLRANPEGFVADDCDVRRMFHDHTSGTTGKSLSVWFNRKAVRFWYALFEARVRRWNGVSRHDRWAILGGQLVIPSLQKRPPFWVWNAASKQLYMSSYHLAPHFIPHYLDAIQKYRIRYLLGYTSSLYELALGAIRSGRRNRNVEVVITNAEPVYDYQKEVIKQAFDCPVIETYGMAEIATAGSQCEAGIMHLWPEVGRVEIINKRQNSKDVVSGDIVATGLINTDMPLIRYRTQDTASIAGNEESCLCLRSLPIIKSLDGRSDDVLYTQDGKRIGRLDPVFKANLPVVEAQIIQESLNLFRVLIVPTDGYTWEAGQSIADLIKERIGEGEVHVETVSNIPRGTNGKFRAVVNNLPKAEMERLNKYQ